MKKTTPQKATATSTSSSGSSCRVQNTVCQDSELVKAARELLDGTKTNSVLSAITPLSDQDKIDIENALIQYEKECGECASRTGNDVECMDAVKENFRRRMPSTVRQIYPWRNYDWDYGTHAENNYSPDALPKPDGSFRGMMNGVQNVVKTIDGMMFTPSPGVASSAFREDRQSDFPAIRCKKDVRCRGTEQVKRMLTQEEMGRMNTPFLKRNLNGEMSSSYFFQIGTCPRDDIISEKKCREKGFIWTKNRFSSDGGNCNQPRYAFVDNSAKPIVGGSNARGQLVAIASNVRQMGEVDLLAGFMESSSGNLEIMPCPKVRPPIRRKERFTTESNENTTKVVSMICATALIAFLIYRIKTTTAK
jgi:hypothetical protein